MTNFPDTRLSLLLRLPASASREVDQHAWAEFAAVYSPLVYRFARRRGLQDSDSHELVQRVLLSVARSIDGWRPGEGRPRFRNWLFTIARNHLINIFKSTTRDATRNRPLEELPSTKKSVEERLQDDFRREAFLWAAARIKHQLAEHTWLAFWKTTVEGLDCGQVARELKITIGTVYAARSRVLAKVKSEIALFTSEFEGELA
jgi:RNA polymerase sigma factor (sigma-70 family)